MPVYATRKLRNLAAALIIASGLTHIAQLWFVRLEGTVLLTALLGVFYLLIGLGLAGQSRFTLWIAVVLPATVGATVLGQLTVVQITPLLVWHLLVDVVVASLCANILYRTRHAEMD